MATKNFDTLKDAKTFAAQVNGQVISPEGGINGHFVKFVA